MGFVKLSSILLVLLLISGTVGSSFASTTIPSAPLNLIATPSSTQASLSWSLPASNGGAGISDYVIQYKKHTDSTWTTFPHSPNIATLSTVNGLVGNNQYDFKVAAVNSAGTGQFSNVITITTSGTLPPPSGSGSIPSAPLALSGTAGNSQVTLKWSPPTTGVPTDYVVQYKPSNQGPAKFVIFNDGVGTSTTATVTGLVAGQPYDFQVSAVNSAGTSSPSNMITVPLSVSTAPTNTPSTTTLSLLQSLNSVNRPDGVYVQVTGSSPTGTVVFSISPQIGTFYPSSCVLLSASSSVAECSVQLDTPTIGAATITANYGGDSVNAASSGTASLTVNPAPASSTTVTLTPSTVAVNSLVEIVTKVTTSLPQYGDRSVTFSASSAGIFNPTSCPTLSVGISCTVTFIPTTPGTVTITANFGGDSVNAASSGTALLTVNSDTSATTPTTTPTTPSNSEDQSNPGPGSSYLLIDGVKTMQADQTFIPSYSTLSSVQLELTNPTSSPIQVNVQFGIQPLLSPSKPGPSVGGGNKLLTLQPGSNTVDIEPNSSVSPTISLMPGNVYVLSVGPYDPTSPGPAFGWDYNSGNPYAKGSSVDGYLSTDADYVFTTFSLSSGFGAMLPQDPPLKQIQQGIAPKDVTCSSDMQLIFRPGDNSPACVTPSTAQELVIRGWIKN